jgi:hypothetical protein
MRRDQENVSEQLGSGLAAWRMPIAALDGNSAWLEIARLAWNLGTWIVQLVLRDEVVRWEWKRFRQAFVDAAAQVICSCRQKLMIRISAAHRWYAAGRRASEASDVALGGTLQLEFAESRAQRAKRRLVLPFADFRTAAADGVVNDPG